MKEIDENYFTQQETTKSQKVEDLLREDEKILWRGCPKRKSYVLNKTLMFMPTAIFLAIFDSVLISTLLTNVVYKIQPIFLLFLIVFFVLHLSPVWMIIYSIFKAAREMKNTFYVITNERLLEIKGGMKYISTEVDLNDLDNIQLKHSTIDKILKVGDIYITGKNGSFVMFDLPNSEFIYSKLKELCSTSSEFYVDSYMCNHCGSSNSNSLPRCSYCGAPKDSY